MGQYSYYKEAVDEMHVAASQISKTIEEIVSEPTENLHYAESLRAMKRYGMNRL